MKSSPGFTASLFVGFGFPLPNLRLLDNQDKRRYSDLIRVTVLEVKDLEFNRRLLKK
jgi:hypothetical protein